MDYQNLFDLMHENHGLTLFESEMQDIIQICIDFSKENQGEFCIMGNTYDFVEGGICIDCDLYKIKCCDAKCDSIIRNDRKNGNFKLKNK